jgi:hypothetical protein
MALSANYTFQLNRNDMLRRAFQLAGVLPAEQEPNNDDYAMASDFLNLELDAIQGEGHVLRSITRTTLSLADGTSSYVLPATVLDVLEPAAVKLASDTTETPVQLIGRAAYTTLTQKTQEGRPTFMYVEKTASVTVYLWPVPDQTMTLTYQRVGFLFDSDAAGVDMDLSRQWHKAVTYMMAGNVALARNQDLSKVKFLLGEGERLKRIARSYEQERGDSQFIPAPGYRWDGL